MELRHLDTLLAIAEEGSFTAAADALATVQSNVSDQVRQLEAELGVPLLVRSRQGRRTHRVRHCSCSSAHVACDRELEAMRVDLALLQGLDAGYARLGVVGTASRWLVPALVADLRERAPGRAAPRERGCVGAAVRRAGRRRARAGGRHRAGERPAAGGRATCSRRSSSASSVATSTCRASRCRWRCSPKLPLVLPPDPNPLRIEVDAAAEAAGHLAHGAGRGRGHPADRRPRRRRRLRVDPARDRDPARARPTRRTVTIAGLPPRRLAMVTARDAQLSLADQAVRDSVRSLVEKHMQYAVAAARSRYGHARRGRWRSMADATGHDDGRKVNVKLIVVRAARRDPRAVRAAEHPRGRASTGSSTPGRRR